MSRREHEPLTAEERELALRLSRLESGAAPSASLDARILEAARSGGETTTPRPVAPVRPHRRWPVAMGLAASLVVAVGVAWQLRPQPESHLLDAPAGQTGAAAPAAAEVAAPAADAATAPSEIPSPGTHEEAVPVAPPPAPSPAPRSRRTTTAAAPPGPARSTQPARQVSDLARDADAQEMRAHDQAVQHAARSQAAQAREVTPVAPPAPGEPAATDGQPEALRLQPAAAARAPEFVISLPPPSPPAPPAAPAVEAIPTPAAAALPQPATRAPSPAPDRIEVSGTRVAEEMDVLADQPLDDRPPATADSPAIRESWLQRIRELRDAGRGDEARDSLREFVRRHPHAGIPADLRPLLEG